MNPISLHDKLSVTACPDKAPSQAQTELIAYLPKVSCFYSFNHETINVQHVTLNPNLPHNARVNGFVQYPYD